jgi:serine/threonine-protein kinase
VGQPYLVLEYVDGKPIDQYVPERQLPTDARIQLFLQVLAAVGHAHANLIVHRDLKPSNILVTQDGTVKLLDFGIAKLVDSESEDRTALTVEGGRVSPLNMQRRNRFGETPSPRPPTSMPWGCCSTCCFPAGILPVRAAEGKIPGSWAG